MITRVDTPQTRCRAAFARADVTPPVGIYHRMWGAALHDRAAAVHRPLTAKALWLEPAASGDARLVLALDHCILDREEIARVQDAAAAASPVPAANVLVTLS